VKILIKKKTEYRPHLWIRSERTKLMNSQSEALTSSIDWATRQSAALFQLKAATDLAELLLSQGTYGRRT